MVDNNKTSNYDLPGFINKNVSASKAELEKNAMKVYVLGEGEKVINQYPKENNKLYRGSVVVLLTDKYDKKMPSLIGLSYKDATNILKLMGVKYSLEGNGYVVSQSVPEGIIVNNETGVALKLENSYSLGS